MAKSLLVVDDNFLNRDMLSRRLIRHNYEVRTAESAEGAVESAVSEPPDLILLDMMLPDKSGADVAVLLRQESQTRNVPIIAVSSVAMEHDRVHALESGCDHYVTKPINFANLLELIEMCLNSSTTVR
jgi:DNA-binding response OmpR family regulator